MQFRVGTLNLEQDHKRWSDRHPLISAEIAALKPDVIAFNEVSVPLQTAKLLRDSAITATGIPYKLVQQTRVNGLSKVEAEALLTQFPIIETGNLDYQARDIVALVVRVEIVERPVDFYVTHLYMSRGDDSLRLFQLQQLLQWIDQRADGTPSIVCGDFNASLDAPSARLMATRFRPTQTAATAFTPLADRDGEVSHPYWPRMDRCIDYIWFPTALRSSPAKSVSTGRARTIHRYGPPTMPVFGPTFGYKSGFKRFGQASWSRAMTIPQVIPFFSAAANFAASSDTPREFLERCLARLEAFEPAVGAFVCHDIAAARAAADRSAARWRDGRPLSPIDGMPLGIKDIIETADMPTEQGSPLFVSWRTGRDAASVAALREAGAVILGKVVTTEFAATEPRGTRNPWDRERTPGGSSSGSAAAVACGMVPAALGTQVVGSILRPASFCGCVGFKPSVGGINRGGSYDYFSQSCTGVLAASLEDAWLVALNIASRAGGDPGYPGLEGPAEPPTPRSPRSLAVLQTSGWADAASEARLAFEAAVARLADAGIALADRHADPVIEEVEEAIADAAPLTRTVNAWEGRWPLNTYRNRDASKLSRPALDRLALAEAMTLAGYGAAIAVRQRNRQTYARVAARYDAAITLSAPAAAPVGLGSTGNPVFNVPASMLGIPAVSLPLLSTDGLPLGLQIAGFVGEDARLFAVAAAIRDLLHAAH